MTDQHLVHRDPEILGGVPVFTGTRVPIKTLFDYLEGGDRLEEFLDNFPTVSRPQAVGVLQRSRHLLIESLYAHPVG